MKKLILFTWLVLSSVQCNSQKTNTMIPTVDNKFEKLKEIFDKSRVDFETETEYIIFTSANSGYGISFLYKNNHFSCVKNFYTSKTIENKGIRFNNGSPTHYVKGDMEAFGEKENKLISLEGIQVSSGGSVEQHSEKEVKNNSGEQSKNS